MTDNVSTAISVADKAVAALDPLGKALTVIIEKATTATEVGVNFLLEQIPDVLRQLLVWKMTESLMSFLTGLVIAVIGVVVLVKARKSYQTNAITNEHYEPTYEAVFGLAAVAAIVVGLMKAADHIAWLQILIAPKIYLIEYGASLYRVMGK